MGTEHTPKKSDKEQGEKATNRPVDTRKLTESIMYMYVCIAVAFVVVFFIIPGFVGPVIVDAMVGNNKGVESVGSSFAAGLTLRIIQVAISFVFLVANPIRVLIMRKKELSALENEDKQSGRLFLIILPIILFFLLAIITFGG